MDGVSLQQFLELRQSAQTRMQTSVKSTENSWQSVLEAKRREFGVASTSTQELSSQSTRSSSQASLVSDGAQGDYRARAEVLKAQMAQGMPVRRVGNLLDVRA